MTHGKEISFHSEPLDAAEHFFEEMGIKFDDPSNTLERFGWFFYGQGIPQDLYCLEIREVKSEETDAQIREKGFVRRMSFLASRERPGKVSFDLSHIRGGGISSQVISIENVFSVVVDEAASWDGPILSVTTATGESADIPLQ